MIDIVLASNNKKKISELQTMFNSYRNGEIRVLSLKDIGYTEDIEEYGKTFEENSLIKANVPASLGYIGIADDSGLSVDALGGAPGIYSARYAAENGSENASDADNREKLLREMASVPENERTAHFVCVMSLVLPENSPFAVPEELKADENSCKSVGVTRDRALTLRGECYGKILTEEVGDGGFGYDCLFYSNDLGVSFGVAAPEEKNKVSHRSAAVEKLKAAIDKLLND